jgi:DNA-binding NarL/FixJ family response regulator
VEGLRVLVADDHDIVRAIIVTLLSSEFQLVGAVADGEQLLQAAIALQPDVIVSDVSMPLVSGLEARTELLSRGIEVIFVFITTLDIESFRSGAEEAPTGYVHKMDLITELTLAVREVARGGSYVSRSFQENPGSP